MRGLRTVPGPMGLLAGLLVLFLMVQPPLWPRGTLGLLGWPPWDSLGDFLRCPWDRLLPCPSPGMPSLPHAGPVL